MNNVRGFTLLELLACFVIIAALAGLGFGVWKSAAERAAAAKEIAAAKTLITAWHSRAADHAGAFLPAIDKTAGSPRNPVWFEPYGRNITYAEAPHRYPFRLAPYFGYRLKGVILMRDNRREIEGMFGKIGSQFSDYGVSLCPALGLNRYYVGGYREPSGVMSVQSRAETVTRSSHADVSILVFASAGAMPDGETKLTGFHEISPPTGAASSAAWSSSEWKSGANAANYGCVDARYGGKAVCAFLDGSVRMHSIEELRDMRLWSRNAALADDSHYSAR